MLWQLRSAEEAGLFNASFLAVLLWHAARGHASDAPSTPLPFELAFLVLPIALHKEMRESLPKATTTSLAVWLDEHPLARSRIADRARSLAPFTKEGLMFGGVHRAIKISNATVTAEASWAKRIEQTLRSTSDEAQACVKKGEFVGKWFARTGNAATVMALVGVRP